MKIIFLHGLGQVPNSWQKIQQQLKTHTSNISMEAWNLFQDLDRKKEITIQTLHETLTEKLALEDEPYLLCGLSLGGLLSLLSAATRPRQLQGVILASVSYQAPNKLNMFLIRQLMRCLPKKQFKELNITKKELITIQSSLATIQLTEQQLTEIQTPSLIICGTRDKMNLASAKRLAQQLPNSRLELIEDGNHELNIEKPEIFGSLIQSFLKEIYFI
ncbi:alpha/beta fold hydrolase [Enterococcus nangangensis]|uniref:alpha/beta fold hydrolase n=1 Tax=Enterococcus nangangensis TaxID=2559926 RepID=UPI0010F788E5|nr:alpha/beta hydrolase [Enterococcus nangangensis]